MSSFAGVIALQVALDLWLLAEQAPRPPSKPLDPFQLGVVSALSPVLVSGIIDHPTLQVISGFQAFWSRSPSPLLETGAPDEQTLARLAQVLAADVVIADGTYAGKNIGPLGRLTGGPDVANLHLETGPAGEYFLPAIMFAEGTAPNSDLLPLLGLVLGFAGLRQHLNSRR